MRHILNSCNDRTGKATLILLLVFVLLFQLMLPAHAQAIDTEVEFQEALIEEDEEIVIISEPDVQNDETEMEPSQLLIGQQTVGQLIETGEIEVDTPSALQTALKGDAPVIKINPLNGENELILSTYLSIPQGRNVILTADREIRIIGPSGQWLMITGAGAEVNIVFNNVILDGNNAGGGIYYNGPLRVENARIENCFHTNGGAGIFGRKDLTVIDSIFVNNLAETKPVNYSDGGAIYVLGDTPSVNVNIINCIFDNNTSRYGGAVRLDNSIANVEKCEFYGNTSAQGSCIYVASSNLNVKRCILKGSNGSGAIMVNNSKTFIYDSDIIDNNSRGIYGYAYLGDVEITVGGSTKISGNKSETSYGGGIIGYSYKKNGDKTTINIKDNTIISNNEAVTGGGISGYPGAEVIINIYGNAQIVDNTAYENGGGIYGDGAVNINGGYISGNKAVDGGGIYGVSGTYIDINNAMISDNIAELGGGGIWVANLNELTVNNTTFQNNRAEKGYIWSIDTPADEEQTEDAVTHHENIHNSSYTTSYSNAYNNHDVNYIVSFVPTPHTVLYNGNYYDRGDIPVDTKNPYFENDEVIILTPPGSFAKSGYRFTGWNTVPDGSGENFSYNGLNFNPPFLIMGKADVVLYAQWNLKAVESGQGAALPIILRPTPTPSVNSSATLPPIVTTEISQVIEPTLETPVIMPEGFVTIPEESVIIPEDPMAIPEESLIIPGEPVAIPEGNEEIIDIPPGFVVVQSSGNIVEITDISEPPAVQLIPEAEGLFEEADQEGVPIGLWSKNEDDEWIYSEYPPETGTSRWIYIGGPLLALVGLSAGIFFIFFMRRFVEREEFVRMLVREVRINEEIQDIKPYQDVSEESSYYNDIMNAKAAGLLSGFPEDKFKPSVYITREEIAGILAETAHYKKIPITDENIGLIWGKDGERRDSEKLSTKRQVEKIIKGFIEILNNGENAD